MFYYFTDMILDLLSDMEDIKDLWIEGNECYHHKTLYVDNLLSYIKIINSIGEMQRKNEMFLDLVICYRGMENYKWMLDPSIVVNHLSGDENAMCLEFEQLHPSEFENIKNPLDKIAKMQHFALPTRLLDFSLNPLVALYFACNITDEGSINENARVVIHITENTEYKEANKICEYALYGTQYVSNFEKYFEEIYSSYRDFCTVKPMYISQREINQQSVFLVFPPKIEKGEEYHLHGIRKIDQTFMESSFISIIIDAKAKNEILNGLDYLGINKKSLFPELEYTGIYLKNKYKDRLKIALNKYNELIAYYSKIGDEDAVKEYEQNKEMLSE